MKSSNPTACVLLCDKIEFVEGRVDLTGVEWRLYESTFPRKAGFWAYSRIHVPYAHLGQEHRLKISLVHEDSGTLDSSKETMIYFERGAPGGAIWRSVYHDFRETVLPRDGRYTVSVFWDGDILVNLEVPFKQPS